MSLTGKLETDVEIKAPAEKFHDVFGNKPHHMTKAATQHVKTCDLHDGEFGKEGFVVHFTYVHDGVPKKVKEIVESIDDVNLSTTYKVTEGDLLEAYKSFRFIIKAIPEEQGSVVHWTMEYEKLNPNIPDPNSMVQFLINITKDIDAHLIAQA